MADKNRYKVVTIGDMTFDGELHGVKFFRGEADGHFTDKQVEEFQVKGYETTKLPEDAPKKELPKEAKKEEPKKEEPKPVEKDQEPTQKETKKSSK